MNMFETLYLHVGIEKTGTTSIQKSLDQNREALLELGYYYPKQFSVGLNSNLAAMFLNDAMSRTNMKLIIDKNGGTQEAHFNEMNKSLTKEIKPIDVPNLVLSSEFLAAGTDINRIKAWCKTLAREVKIIIYLREQCSLLVSHQSTNLKGGGTPVKIKSIKKRQDLSMIYNVKGMVSRWEKAFSGQLDVRIFHRDRLIDGDSVQDFYHAINIKDWKPNIETDQSNISLSLVGSAFLKKMNDVISLAKDGELNPVRSRIIEDIGVQDSEEDYGRRRLTEEEREIVSSLFIDSNEVIRSRYFPDQSKLFPEYKTGKPKVVSVDDILDYAIKLIDKAYSNQLKTTKDMQSLRIEHKRAQEDMLSKIDLAKAERNELLERLNQQEEKRVSHIKALKTQVKNLQKDRNAGPFIASADVQGKLDELKFERTSLLERLNAQKETTGNHISALKAQVEKLQADRDDARIKYRDLSEKSDADLRSAMTTFNTKFDAMRDERDAIIEKFNRRREKGQARRQEFTEKMQKLSDDLDLARAKLKAQSETSKQDKKEAVSTFNTKMDALRKERDTALKQAKSAGKKYAKQFKGLSAQILALTTSRDESQNFAKDKDKKIKTLTQARDEALSVAKNKDKTIKTLTKARDEARSVTKDKDKTIKTLTKARDEARSVTRDKDKTITTLTKARDEARSVTKDKDKTITTLTKARDEARSVAKDKDKTIKTLTKARDDARKAFEAKEKQSKIQSGQVYYFRAELLRLKDNLTEARKMYEQAVEQDPGNETYQNRLAELDK